MDDYIYDDYEGDYEDNYYTDTEIFTPRFDDIAEDCIWPSLVQISGYAGKLLLTNLVFRVFTQTVKIKPCFQHGLSALSGSLLIYLTIEKGSLYIYGFTMIPYLLLFLLHRVHYRRLGYVISALIIAALLICETFEKSKRVWHQLRGVLMIVVMKIISLGFDLDVAKPKEFPGFLTYLGYILCPSSVILGPWHSFSEYKSIFESRIWNLKYIINVALNVVVSLGFLLSSNCIVYSFIPDNSWKWFLAYRDALAFRCSHYFISFLSQATMVCGGFTTPSGPSLSSHVFGYEVTKPHKLELPRSLVQVVKNWNIPMHNWLKQYVFRIVKPHSTFAAILLIYIVSSVLHGINLQVGAILLSLGFYTFVEYKLRQKISSIYSSCTLANSCGTSCQEHDLKSNAVFSVGLNCLFAGITVFHLAYLGVVFEAAFHIQEEGFSLQHLTSKWGALNYASHWTVLFTYLFHLII